jgi:hypothetical protein
MKCTLTAVAVLLLASTYAHAGVRLVVKRGMTQATVYLDGNKFRVEQKGPGAKSRILIFDGGTQVLTVADPQHKTYFQLNAAQIKDLGTSLRADLNKKKVQTQTATAKIIPTRKPGDNRKPVKASPKLSTENKNTEPLKYEPTGRKQIVAGYSCVYYREVRLGKSYSEGCYIPWGSSAVSKDDVRPIILMGDFFSQMLPEGAGGGQHLVDAFTGGPGFPAFREEIGRDSRRENPEKLISVNHENISKDKFAAPAGYKKLARMLRPD